MAAVLWVFAAVGNGCLLAWRFAGLRDLCPRWAAALVLFGAGVAGGIGITSVLFFLCRLAMPSTRIPAMLLEIALAAFLSAQLAQIV